MRYYNEHRKRGCKMTYPVIHTCPVCAHALHVQKLACSQCHTVIENNFSLSKFAALSKEEMEFIEVFVVKRGNIKEVEKVLGISYPTVRGKLNDIIAELDHDEAEEENNEKLRKSQVIAMLENDEISAKEAVALLKNNRLEE